MATRAVIKIEGVNFAQIYKHWDGHPDSTLSWLKVFNADFQKNRGDDPTYKFAQLLRDSGREETQEAFGLDPSQYTGWGVYPYDAECGAEFEYLLKNDGTVTWKEL